MFRRDVCHQQGSKFNLLFDVSGAMLELSKRICMEFEMMYL